ncbi:MAG TPA: cation transporter [Gemmatimonadales bacterium]|jgi:copper chaperone CopZ
MEAVTLHIDGMSCSHCLNAVSKALHAVPGITVDSVQIGRAELQVAKGSDVPGVISAVADAGYSASVVAGPAQ